MTMTMIMTMLMFMITASLSIPLPIFQHQFGDLGLKLDLVLDLNTFAALYLPIGGKVHIGFQNNRQPLFQTEKGMFSVTTTPTCSHCSTLSESRGVQ